MTDLGNKPALIPYKELPTSLRVLGHFVLSFEESNSSSLRLQGQ